MRLTWPIGPAAPSTTTPIPLFSASSPTPCSPSVCPSVFAPCVRPNSCRSPAPFRPAGPMENFCSCPATAREVSVYISPAPISSLAGMCFLRTASVAGTFPGVTAIFSSPASGIKSSPYPETPPSTRGTAPPPPLPAKNRPTPFFSIFKISIPLDSPLTFFEFRFSNSQIRNPKSAIRIRLIQLPPTPRPPAVQQSPCRPLLDRFVRLLSPFGPTGGVTPQPKDHPRVPDHGVVHRR